MLGTYAVFFRWRNKTVVILESRHSRKNKKNKGNRPVSILVYLFILVSQSVSPAVSVLSVNGWEIACRLFHLLCHELFQFYVVIFYRKEACFRVRPAPPR